MSSLQRRTAAVTEMAANLVAQLRELDQLREQVRNALLSAKRSPRPERSNTPSIAPLSRNDRTRTPPPRPIQSQRSEALRRSMMG
jgi:hypothetical protein